MTSAPYVQRSLTTGDDLMPLLGWFADEELMAGMNLPARSLSLAQVKKYVASFDNENRILFGIFAADGALIGTRLVEIEPFHRRAEFFLLVGDRERWDSGVTVHTGLAFYDWLFGERGVNKVIAQIRSDNAAARRRAEAAGYAREATLLREVRDPRGDGYVDLERYIMFADDWPRLRERFTATIEKHVGGA